MADWPGNDYVWEREEGVDLQEMHPLQLEAPDGYRLHSWERLGASVVLVCWERVELSWFE